jgi:hypothetical protein
MSTPNPVAPTAAQLVNSDLMNMLLTTQANLENEIAYLGNAANLLTDRQAKLAAVQAQLTSLGYVPPPAIVAAPAVAAAPAAAPSA